MSLSGFILAALALGIGFGAAVHHWLPDFAGVLDHNFLTPLGQGFLRLIQFVVVPIIFSSLVLGVTRVQQAGRMGQCLLKLFSSYLLTSLVAISIGVGVAWVLQPGASLIQFAPPSQTVTGTPPDLLAWLLSLIPTNPLVALNGSNLLQTIVAAALISLGIQASGDQAKPFLALLESVYAIAEQVLKVILRVAPVGVFALMGSVIATQGLEAIVQLLGYIEGLLVAIALMLAFYSLLLWVCGISPMHYYRSFFPSIFLAFGTASSNAALPVALDNAQDNYGLDRAIASFAIPLGTALKRDGSAILHGFNALFVAQMYQVPLTPTLLVAIALSTLLVSMSTAGVPGAGLIMITTVLVAAGLPVEGVALVAGIDRLTDGFRAAMNVVGNTANAAILGQLTQSPTLKETADLGPAAS
jgi:proton glutamate symport protein